MPRSSPNDSQDPVDQYFANVACRRRSEQRRAGRRQWDAIARNAGAAPLTRRRLIFDLRDIPRARWRRVNTCGDLRGRSGGGRHVSRPTIELQRRSGAHGSGGRKLADPIAQWWYFRIRDAGTSMRRGLGSAGIARPTVRTVASNSRLFR